MSVFCRQSCFLAANERRHACVHVNRECLLGILISRFGVFARIGSKTATMPRLFKGAVDYMHAHDSRPRTAVYLMRVERWSACIWGA